MKPRAALLLVGLAAAVPAAAAPVDDALAQVAELRRSLIAQDERIGRLEAQLQNQGLLKLLNQVETLKAEVARLRGGQEEQAYRLESADRRTRDLFSDLDGRLKEIANRPVPPPPDAVRLQVTQSLLTPAPVSATTSVSAPPDSEGETRTYEAAQALVKAGKYREAVAAFQSFLKQYPNGALAANALYWIGFSHVGLSDFREASLNYQRMLQEFPNSAKVQDAMLSLARVQVQMNEPDLARATLEQLIARYPQGKAAENGRKLLATLK